MQILLAVHAQVDIVTNQGWSALHFAIERGHLSIVLLLLSAGANVNLMTKERKTPRDLATIKLLMQTGENIKNIVSILIIEDKIIEAGGVFGATLAKQNHVISP